MSREAQRNNLMTGFSQNPRVAFKGPTQNHVIPRHAYVPAMSSSDNRLPGGVIPYNNFYFTTVTNTGNYPAAAAVAGRSNVNPIIATNSASVSASPLISLPTVNVSAISGFQLPSAIQQAASEVLENEGAKELRPDGDPSIKLNPNSVSPRRFINYAISLARSPNCLTYQFLPLRRTEAEQMTLKSLTSLLSANNAFGIYSESPFLRPVALLRPVQFASPANVLFQYPDPENMVRTLRDLADQKVTSVPLLAILSGAKPNAASLGFYTDYLTYSFTLELDINTMRFLVDQSRQPNSRTDKYRLILRLAWATTGLYMPRDKSNPSRVLASEVLPRCLSVRVARRNVTLPDPIFHGGQAQKLGHRLRFAIDITDKIPARSNSSVRDRSVDIDLTWLHAPLEDHALPLLEMVGSGSCTPILNHLLNLPLVQVTLDRVQPIPEFVRMFSSAVAGQPVTDPPTGCKPPHLPSETPEALVGVYDFCRSPIRVISASDTLKMVKSKLTSEDDLQCDEWIPVSLLCPLTLTRIDIPVRSVNCDHLQCFDLSSYLTINKKRPRWSCPVCSSPAPFRDLRRDDFFVRLLADQSLQEADLVHVDANGHWREASKPTESCSPAVASAMESAADIQPDNPPPVAVTSLVNGTSTMSPCKVESSFASRPVVPPPPAPDFSQFDADCVVLIDTDDEEDDRTSAGVTQPTQPTFTQPASANVSRGPPVPVAPTVKEPQKESTPPPETPDSVPTNLFVDLTASSDEESNAPAPPPPPSNPQPPTPSSAPPITTESRGVPTVVPNPPSTRLLSSLAPPPISIAPRPSGLVRNASQPASAPPTAAAAAASADTVAVSTTTGASSTPLPTLAPSKLNKTIDLNYELITHLTSSMAASTAAAAAAASPGASTNGRSLFLHAMSLAAPSAGQSSSNQNSVRAAVANHAPIQVNSSTASSSGSSSSGSASGGNVSAQLGHQAQQQQQPPRPSASGRFKVTAKRRCPSPSSVDNGASDHHQDSSSPAPHRVKQRVRVRGRRRVYTGGYSGSNSSSSSSSESPSSEEDEDDDDLWTPSSVSRRSTTTRRSSSRSVSRFFR